MLVVHGCEGSQKMDLQSEASNYKHIQLVQVEHLFIKNQFA